MINIDKHGTHRFARVLHRVAVAKRASFRLLTRQPPRSWLKVPVWGKPVGKNASLVPGTIIIIIIIIIILIIIVIIFIILGKSYFYEDVVMILFVGDVS